jgi:hypothetical protein
MKNWAPFRIVLSMLAGRSRTEREMPVALIDGSGGNCQGSVGGVAQEDSVGFRVAALEGDF